MDDLISRTAAIAEIEEFLEEYAELDPKTGYHSFKWCAMMEAKDVLIKLPTVEPKRGRWERHFSRPNVYADLYWWCTCCGRPSGDGNAYMYDYCPHCGAKMEGGENDG